MKFIQQLVQELVEPEHVKLNIKYHKKLNPALWDDKKLKPEVEKKLKEIADTFVKFLKVEDLNIVDIIVTGSNANYNWTPLSDIDLHIVVNLDELREKCNSVLVDEFFFAKKKIWNDMHEIKIRGHNVELYTQDEKEKHTASGIYSLQDKKWKVKPQYKEPKIDDVAVKAKTAQLMNEIDDVIQGSASNINEIEKIKDKIKKFRKTGLEKEGEFSTENLVFKTLRNNGYLEKLFDSYTTAIDKELSL